jgi:hypothetical protein
MAKTNTPAKQNDVTLSEGEYKGHALLVFSAGEEDRFPFQFGCGKARRILAVMDEMGPKEFAERVRSFLAKHAGKD